MLLKEKQYEFKLKESVLFLLKLCKNTCLVHPSTVVVLNRHQAFILVEKVHMDKKKKNFGFFFPLLLAAGKVESCVFTVMRPAAVMQGWFTLGRINQSVLLTDSLIGPQGEKLLPWKAGLGCIFKAPGI